MNQLKDIAAFCRQRIADYDERVRVALGKMEERRCDLKTADWELAGEIESAAQEWAERNGYAVDFFEGIDVEEIIWNS